MNEKVIINGGYERYEKHFPNNISEEIKEYAENEVLTKYLFIRKEGKQQYGYCSHCGKESATIGLEHNEESICPNCMEKVIVKSPNRFRKPIREEAYFVYYEKSLIEPDTTIIARGIITVRNYFAKEKRADTHYRVIDLYIFKNNESLMFNRSAWWNENFYIRNSVFPNNFGHIKNIYHCCSYKSIESAVNGTPFQYSCWKEYFEEWGCMVRFFDCYAKYPCIEYLTKEGFNDLVRDKVYKRNTYGAVNWRADSILKILKINKKDLRDLKQYKNGEKDAIFIKLFQISQKDKSKLTCEEIYKISSEYRIYFQQIKDANKYVSLRKITNYINKQRCNFKNSSKCGILITYADYLYDCERLEFNMKDENVLFPKNLYNAHQNTIRQVKIKENKELDAKIAKRIKTLQKYNFEYRGLTIRSARSSIELIDEGKFLHHCVATYTEKYANGSTNILFIRKMSEIDKPYYTVEIKDNKIYQVRGKNNRSASDDVKEFIEAYKEKILNENHTKNRVKILA